MNAAPEEWYIPEDIDALKNGVHYPSAEPIQGDKVKVATALHTKAVAAYANNVNQSLDVSFIHDKHVYRCHRRESIRGDWFVLRRIPKKIPKLDKQIKDKEIRKFIMERSHSDGGIIVVTGKAGSGKTTTCSSIIKERLTEYEGVCHAIEKPAEYEMQGRHGKGFCIQTNVYDTESMSSAIDNALRCYPVSVPNLMFIGEIKTKEEFAVLLNAAANSTLIILTIHAYSEIGALHRMRALIPDNKLKESLSLLASTLKLVIHQEIINEELYIKPLIMTTAVEVKVKEGRIESLQDEINIQNKQIKSGELMPAWVTRQ